jgi:hypothetical protein
VRCLERQTFSTPRMHTLSLSKNIKRSNYWEFLKVKNVLFMYMMYYRQQHTSTLRIWKTKPKQGFSQDFETFTELQISCVFAFFTLWKRVKTHVLSDQSVHLRIHIAVLLGNESQRVIIMIMNWLVKHSLVCFMVFTPLSIFQLRIWICRHLQYISISKHI